MKNDWGRINEWVVALDMADSGPVVVGLSIAQRFQQNVKGRKKEIEGDDDIDAAFIPLPPKLNTERKGLRVVLLYPCRCCCCLLSLQSNGC